MTLSDVDPSSKPYAVERFAIEYVMKWPDDPRPPCSCQDIRYIDHGRIQVHSNDCLLRQWIKRSQR